MSAIPFGGRFAVSEYVRTATQTPFTGFALQRYTFFLECANYYVFFCRLDGECRR